MILASQKNHFVSYILLKESFFNILFAEKEKSDFSKPKKSLCFLYSFERKLFNILFAEKEKSDFGKPKKSLCFLYSFERKLFNILFAEKEKI